MVSLYYQDSPLVGDSQIVNFMADYLSQLWKLTERESAVLSAIVRGNISSSKISEIFGFTISTADKHIESISAKSGLTGRVGLVGFWLNLTNQLLAVIEERVLNKQSLGNVFISEDDQDVGRIIESIVLEAGFTPILLLEGNVLDGSLVPQLGPSDIVVLDMGYNCQFMTRYFLNPQIEMMPYRIAITGNSRLVDREAHEFLWDEFYLKPLNRNELIFELRKAFIAIKAKALINKSFDSDISA